MAEKVLEFNNVGKLYMLGQVGTGTLSRDLSRWWTTRVRGKEDPYQKIGETNDRSRMGDSDFVWALKDISFSVEKGDVVGIIGKNGSGKSTLLKILSRITTPTRGSISIKGRTASLLEVGTGFHKDLTGRDNVYMNGAILGMTRQEIKKKLDDIVDFAGVARYVDTPVKRYSSGMMVRLGFAVAAFLEPEILIVDEVLAVGDADFQKRAVGKMKDISKEDGRTVLFVSHNMNSVMQLCNRGILLNNGRLLFDENIADVVAKYNGLYAETTSFEGFDGMEGVMGVRKARIYSLGPNPAIFQNSDTLIFECEVDIMKTANDLVAGVNLFSQFDGPLARSDFNDRNGLRTLEPGRYIFRYEIPPYSLSTGSYKLKFGISEYKERNVTTEKSALYFDVYAGPDNYGSMRVIRSPRFESLMRPDWFRSVERIDF